MIESVKPDIIVRTESWLKPDITSSEVFSLEDYQVIRKDWTNRKGGGVFIMARREFTLVREEELETDCELIWGRLSIYGRKPLHIGAYYRWEEKDEDSLDQLQMSLSRLKKTDSIVLAGDFNLPGWNWKDNYVKTSCQHPRLHEKFGNIINDAGLEQIIDLPTRLDNTLDLVCTNTPSKVDHTEILPPISDHSIPLVEMDIRPIRITQKPRKIHLYKRADWDAMETEMKELNTKIQAKMNEKNPDELWSKFKNTTLAMMDKYIPSKVCKKRDKLPYMTGEIHRLINRKNRAHKQRKKAQRNSASPYARIKNLDKKVRDLKNNIQKKMRQAYWQYIQSIITPTTDDTIDSSPFCAMKRFWQYIKSTRKDYTWVATLKVNGKIINDPKEKADQLNKQFESVFTHETEVQPDLLPEASPYPVAPEVHIQEKGVRKMLEGL